MDEKLRASIIPESHEIDEKVLSHLKAMIDSAFDNAGENTSKDDMQKSLNKIEQVKPRIKTEKESGTRDLDDEEKRMINLSEFKPRDCQVITYEREHYPALLALVWIKLQEEAGISLIDRPDLLPVVAQRIKDQLEEEFPHADAIADNPEASCCFGASIYRLDNEFFFYPFVGFSGSLTYDQFLSIFDVDAAVSETDKIILEEAKSKLQSLNR